MGNKYPNFERILFFINYIYTKKLLIKYDFKSEIDISENMEKDFLF